MEYLETIMKSWISSVSRRKLVCRIKKILLYILSNDQLKKH